MRHKGGCDASKARHEDLVFAEDLEYKRPRAKASGVAGGVKKKKYASKTKKGKKKQPKGGGGRGGGSGGMFQSASMVQMPNGGMFRVRS